MGVRVEKRDEQGTHLVLKDETAGKRARQNPHLLAGENCEALWLGIKGFGATKLGRGERGKMIRKRTSFEYKIAGDFMQTYSVGLSETNHPGFTQLGPCHYLIWASQRLWALGGRAVGPLSSCLRWRDGKIAVVTANETKDCSPNGPWTQEWGLQTASPANLASPAPRVHIWAPTCRQ